MCGSIEGVSVCTKKLGITKTFRKITYVLICASSFTSHILFSEFTQLLTLMTSYQANQNIKTNTITERIV